MLGKFITFEGANGVGKTTYTTWLTSYLNDQQNVPTILTTEPRGIEQGRQIYDRLFMEKVCTWSAMSQFLLYCAARYEHVHQTIKPALEKGIWVICDRFYDSTIAYQGYAQGLDLKTMYTIQRQIFGDFSPYLTFILDLDPEVALERARVKNKHQSGLYPQQDTTFQHRIRQGYLKIAEQYPERCVVLPTHSDITSIKKQILTYIHEQHVNSTLGCTSS